MKKLLFAFLLIFVGICAYYVHNYYTRGNILYITIPSHGIRERVPDDIVKSRDCDKYMEWHSNQAWAVFAPHGIRCPWRKPYGEFGYFEINGVKLKVPRKDLDDRFSTDIPDGKEHDLSLRYVAPEMIAASEVADADDHIDPKCPKESPLWEHNIYGKVLNYNVVKVKIIGGDYLPNACTDEGVCENYQSCKTKVYCDSVQADYAMKIHAWDKNQRLDYRPEFKFIKKEFGLDLYLLTYYNSYYKKRFTSGPWYHVKGDPYEPEEWLICTGNGESVCETGRLGYCQTKFYLPSLGKKLKINLKFASNEFLPKHEELKKLVIQKIQSYIIQQTK